MGRTLIEMCKFVGCFPSELYKKHNPTVGDQLAISAYWRIIDEEENERTKAILKGLGAL